MKHQSSHQRQANLLSAIRTADPSTSHRIAAELARCSEVLEQLQDIMVMADVRRWIRQFLLPALTSDEARRLSQQLLDFAADFDPGKRDRSTSVVIESLDGDAIERHLLFLAGSNASSALWARMNREASTSLIDAARTVLSRGDRTARETTLHLLVLDPYGPEYLSRQEQNELLSLALDDQDPEIRGLAAEVIATDRPSELLDRVDTAPRDVSERVRAAFWNTAFVTDPSSAGESAAQMVLDPGSPIDARRTALLAAAGNLATRDVAPLLIAVLGGDDEVLVDDAAQLMWRYHRAPDIAAAAAASVSEQARDLAERLLHPERGSPAAGGSRPGDPTRTVEIFDQIRSDRR